LILWLPPEDIWIVYGGDKTGNENTWYTKAALAGEREVEQIINRRQSNREKGE